MVLLRHAKWIAAAGSGIAIGFFNYIQSDKKFVQTSWNANFVPSRKWDDNWDKRDPSCMIKSAKHEDDLKEQNRLNEGQEKLKPTASRVILLICHGEYKDSGENDNDKKLTPLGKKQADYVGKRMKELDFNFSKLTYSTMASAKETADIIRKYFPNIPTESDDLLREGFPILPEPPLDDLRLEEYKSFTDGARIEAAFRKYFHRADPEQKSQSYEIIVCHPNVIRYFVCRVLQFPPEGWSRFGVPHCSLTWIRITPAGLVGIGAIGDTGFLPKSALSE